MRKPHQVVSGPALVTVEEAIRILTDEATPPDLKPEKTTD